MHRLVVMACVLTSCVLPAAAADWPMWRCDAARSGATEQELPAKLHLQWVRHYPALKPVATGPGKICNPKDKTVGFEVAYSPVVLGKTMFVASSHNDSVTALDVETGAERWKFYTGGPVRLAPAAWKGKVYAASDDGHLYCLDAAKGTMLWKFRGAPMKHRVIGDERLGSAWPARGGPVVADRKVYFAASIFPFMGLYIYALDAETGKVVWVNDRRGAQWKWKGEKTAPQGPLALAGDKLLVPNNRLDVTCLDRRTGKYLYSTGGRSGWRACASAKYCLNGGALHDLESGKLLGVVGAFPVLADGVLYAAVGRDGKDGIRAGDLGKLKQTAAGRKPKIDIPKLWDMPGKSVVRRVWLKAGPRLYVTEGNAIFAVDIPAPGGQARVSWTGKVEGTVTGVLAAADRLFVVTREGGIHCFGAAQTAPKTYAVKLEKLPTASDEWTARAGTILKTTGIKDGYALVLGIGSSRLVEELLKQSELHVVAVDPDAKKVDALRRRLDAAGLYGQRAAAITGDPLDCGLPPYLASLIVSEDPKAAGLEKGAAFGKGVFHSLRPYGGVACLPGNEVSQGTVSGWVKSAKLENAEVKASGDFTLLVRAGALPGSAPWTHQYADAGNTVVSKDELQAPLGLLWFGGPSTALSFDRHYFGPRPHVVGGRIIVFGPKGLTTIDVYTGRRLWQNGSPEIMRLAKPYRHKAYRLPGANYLGSYYVSLADGIYVAGGGTCLHLDPATGEKLSEIKLPAGQVFGPIRIWKDVLVAATDPIVQDEKKVGLDKWNATAGRRLTAFDRKGGDLLWSLKADQGFGHNAIAIGEGKVFCIDMWPKTPTAKSGAGKLIALDARTGKTTWSTTENVYGTWMGYSAEHGIALQGAGFRGYKNPNGSRAIAYRAKDGGVLWDKKTGPGPWMLNGKLLITQGRVAFDLATGNKVKTFKRLDGKSCDHDIGSTHLIADREGSAAYVDLDTNTPYRLGGIRSGCMNTLIVADGVLSYPFFARNCTCSLNIRSSMALIRMPELAGGAKLRE